MSKWLQERRHYIMQYGLIIMIRLCSNLVISEEETAHLDFGPREAIFQKPKDSDNHLKALYMRGHINVKPVSRMLVDSGAIVNLMPYSLYKKLGGTDEELIKTNMTVNGVGGGDPIGAKGGCFDGVDHWEQDSPNSFLRR